LFEFLEKERLSITTPPDGVAARLQMCCLLSHGFL